jgi:SPX domain protein involved in polyphosphate accumulation
MRNPNFQERVERNYQVAVNEAGVADLWRDMSDFLPRWGLEPIYAITCVGSVYFDNRDFDLTRFTILNGGRHILVRLRTYESYGESPGPISGYWVEVKIRERHRWRKKRFRLNRVSLAEFLEGKDYLQNALESNKNDVNQDIVRDLYRETQETVLTMGVSPMLLLTYQRIAFQNDFERVCLDSDIRYYHIGTDIYSYDSWKYPIEDPVGKSKKIILEVKHLDGSVPSWISELENRYPIWRTNFSKYVEGMGYLFRGPFKHHKEANYFIPRIETYMANSERL